MTVPFAGVYDVAILGGGVVGVAALRAATLAGYRCALVEARDDLLSVASGSNSGIACTGVDAEEGTVERAAIRESTAPLRDLCQEHNLPTRPEGSLVCEWPWDDDSGHRGTTDEGGGLEEVLQQSRDAGDEVEALDRAGALSLEPSLSPAIAEAVLIAGETVLDPWLVPIALAAHARENGADVFTGFRYEPERSRFDPETKVWTVRREENDEDADSKSGQSSEKRNAPPDFVKAKCVINATGIQCDALQSRTKDAPDPTWEARPRRGQYRIFSADKDAIPRRPIQPVPTPRTKGVFVYSTLYGHLVVGPTAEDQESRTDASIDVDVEAKLESLARRVLRDDSSLAPVGAYVGVRPGIDQRDYRIRTSVPDRWIVAAGVRSTGLTASLGIGRRLTDAVREVLSEEGARTKPTTVVTTPLPPLSRLVEDFRSSRDGSVEIGGHRYRVTHPLTRLGWTHCRDVRALGCG